MAHRSVGATNSQNELTSVGNNGLSYDPNGNTVIDDQGHVLVYDAWNRLVALEDTGGNVLELYAYDGLGQRLTETPTATNVKTDLYYSSQWQVVEEDTVNTSGGGTLALHADYVWSPVFVDALILRDEHLTGSDGSTSFTLQERVYVTQDANYNVTSLIKWGTLQADANGDGVVNQFDFSIMAGNYGQR